MDKIKKLYLVGTNKNVGYLAGVELHIYKRYLKYFPLTIPTTTFSDLTVNVVPPVIFTYKNKKNEINWQLTGHGGFIYNIDTKMWIFYNCTFKTPDNLDVIEMAYLYKNWKANGQIKKSPEDR